MFSHPMSILPVQSSIIWSVHCSNGIHNVSQGSQTDGSKQGTRIHQYQDNWLVRQIQPPNLSPSYSDPSGYVSGFSMDSKDGKIRTGTKQLFDFIGYQIDLMEDKVRPTLECRLTLKLKI